MNIAHIKTEAASDFSTEKTLQFCFIVNPNAGTNMQQRIRESVFKNLDHRRFQPSIWFTEYAGHGAILAQKAIQEGFDVVVAVGGDGSINEIAGALVNTSVSLGLVPAGSGNGLAMHLGYGRQIDEAIQKLNHTTIKRMDYGTLNDKAFFNVAGLGFDGRVSNMMRESKRRGFMGYLINSVKAGFQHKAQKFILHLPEQTIERTCFAIAVANGPMYGYNMEIAPGAALDDGLFSLVLIKEAPKWSYFKAVHSSMHGKILDHNFIEHFAVSNIKIEFEGKQYMHLDGEGFAIESSADIKMQKNALSILVPSSQNNSNF